MNRLFRMRRYNEKKSVFDVLFPQSVTSNILRRDDGGVLETYLKYYDRHVQGSMPHLNRAKSRGTYRKLEANIPGKILVDGFPLVLTVHTGIECEATLNFNGSGDKPILNCAGDRIPGGQCAGSSMFMVWSKAKDAWILLSSDSYSDITKIVLPVKHHFNYEAEYDGQTAIVIPDFDYHSDGIEVNYGQTILRNDLDYEFHLRAPNTLNLKGFSLMKGDLIHCTITKYITTAKHGIYKYTLGTTEYTVRITGDNTNVINLPIEAIGAHEVTVNYGQTILREAIDYEFNENRDAITLKEFSVVDGDIITFKATRFIESNGEVVPNNWGATGNYRYAIKLLREEYEATENNITIVPVPNFNRKKDELYIVRDNHLLVYDVDYTIDTLNQVVLLNSHLDEGDALYFTIRQGAMIDVPNFNVIDATGTSGQHLHIDISYSILCNFYTLVVRLKYNLQTAPTVKCIDGPAEPICDCFGNPVLEGYKAGSFLWLVYNGDTHTWYSLGHGQLDVTSRYPITLTKEGYANFFGGIPETVYVGDDHLGETVIEHGLGRKPAAIIVHPSEPPMRDGNRAVIGDIWYEADETYLYVGNTGDATSKFYWSVTNQDTTTSLTTYLETEIKRITEEMEAERKHLWDEMHKFQDGVVGTLNYTPGRIYTRSVVFESPEDDVYTIPIPDFTYNLDKILVNYGQTILREDLDYKLIPGGIELLNIKLPKDDIVQFVVIRQDPIIENPDLLIDGPVTGDYRVDPIMP